jgi:NAD(P)-dependent dehydrogenase (short-subunit alcohol dehydrogenase family)
LAHYRRRPWLGSRYCKAALAAGHAVVATGRDPAKVTAAIGHHNDLLAIKLDVTRLEDAHAAVAAAVTKFGRIDVVVNNAGNFYAGFFEELSPEQIRNQIETLLFGPMNVTRSVLPVMRKQRAGLLLTLSSTAGITGQMFCTAYAAAKFGIEGLIESLTPEIASFGIRTMLVEPGFFRTELLSTQSTTYAKAFNRRLRRAHSGDRHCVERHEWQTGRRSGEARQRDLAARRTQATSRAIRRRR